MTEETKYRIEEMFTDGWSLAQPAAFNLTKEEASAMISDLIADGRNPNLLRAVVQESNVD